MKTFIALSLLGASILGPICLRAADSPPTKAVPAAEKVTPPKNVNVEEFESLRTDKKNVVLDVRTKTEFAAGHIPGAIHLDANAPDFAKKAAKLDKKKTYLVHCAGGGRSAKACKEMEKLDFHNIYNLQGGMKAWEKAGNKAEK